MKWKQAELFSSDGIIWVKIDPFLFYIIFVDNETGKRIYGMCFCQNRKYVFKDFCVNRNEVESFFAEWDIPKSGWHCSIPFGFHPDLPGLKQEILTWWEENNP